MKEFKVTFEVGAHKYDSFVVEAATEKTAIKRATNQARVWYGHYRLENIQELKPITRVEHDQIVARKDAEIERLYAQIEKIKSVVEDM